MNDKEMEAFCETLKYKGELYYWYSLHSMSFTPGGNFVHHKFETTGGSVINNSVARPLAKFLSVSGPETLEFRENHINGEQKGSSEVIKLLAEALAKNTTVKSLVFEHNRITDGDAKHIGAMLGQNNTITEVSFEYNELTAQGARHIADGIAQNTTIKSVRIANNDIGDDGAVAIINALSPSVTVLDLHDNGIKGKWTTDNNNMSVATALSRCSNLNRINISENDMGDEVVTLLLNSLAQHAIVSLDLTLTRMGDGATAIVAQMIERTNIESVDLSFNHISDKGTEVLIKAIENNQSLRDIHLDGNKKIVSFRDKFRSLPGFMPSSHARSWEDLTIWRLNQ